MTDYLDAPDGAEAEMRAWLRSQPLAILACAAAIAETGRAPTQELTRAASDEASSLAQVPGEVVREQIERILVARHVHLALEWLHEAGALAVLLPELEATVGFSQESGRKHKDVWAHTKQVVGQSVLKPAVRWAALLHDIGKVPTRTFTPEGKVHFHRHAEIGARMFDHISRRLHFEREYRQRIRFLILNHLRANQYLVTWTDSAVRRFDREIGGYLEDLLDLSRADITSRRPGRREALLERIDELAGRIVAINELDARLPPLPTGLGTAISERFGIPPSKRIGDLKRALEEAIERGELEERRDSDYYLDWLAKSGLA
ncbi:MAG: HD domain-containing protein [Pseudomonadota bacterium]